MKQSFAPLIGALFLMGAPSLSLAQETPRQAQADRELSAAQAQASAAYKSGDANAIAETREKDRLAHEKDWAADHQRCPNDAQADRAVARDTTAEKAARRAGNQAEVAKDRAEARQAYIKDWSADHCNH